MGTRSVVAVPKNGGGWKGRYVHWDGYPGGVGGALRAIIERDGVDVAIDTLVVQNYGWSSVDGEAKQELRPGLDDGRFKAVPGYGIAYTEEQGQSSPDEFITDVNFEESWCEYAYVIHPDGSMEGYDREGKLPVDENGHVIDRPYEDEED